MYLSVLIPGGTSLYIQFAVIRAEMVADKSSVGFDHRHAHFRRGARLRLRTEIPEQSGIFHIDPGVGIHGAVPCVPKAGDDA